VISSSAASCRYWRHTGRWRRRRCGLPPCTRSCPTRPESGSGADPDRTGGGQGHGPDFGRVSPAAYGRPSTARATSRSRPRCSSSSTVAPTRDRSVPI
jgi:hypothetical protein